MSSYAQAGGGRTARPCQNLRVRYRLLAPIALLAALGSACSGGSAQPGASPTSHVPRHPSSSTTSLNAANPEPSLTIHGTSPNIQAPRRPSAANRKNLAGARAFARYWFTAWDWAYRSSQTDLLRMVSAPSCSDCGILISTLQSVRKRDEAFRGGQITIRELVAAPNDGRSGADRAFDVTVAQSPLEIVNSAGETVHTEHATARITFRLWLAWTSRGWLVVQKGHVV